MQGHPTPRERQQHAPGTARPPIPQPGKRHHMQRRIQQRRMHPEQPRINHLLRQHDLREHLPVRTPPRRPQPLEHRTVTQPTPGQPVIQPIQLDHGRTPRRPHRRVERLPGLATGCQHTDRMPYPRLLGRSLRLPGVDAQFTPTRLIRRRHPHLHRHRVPLTQHQRRGQGQLLDHITADLITYLDRQLQEPGAREHHRPAHHVIGQPWMRPERDTTGQQHPIQTGQPNSGPQKRVLGSRQPRPSQVSHSRARAIRPETPTLEGVCGQLHLARAREHRTPIERHPTHMQLGQRRHHRALLIPIPAQHRHQHHVRVTRTGVRVGDRGKGLLRHGGQDTIGTKLQIRPHTLRMQHTDTFGEADRAAYLVHPVARRAHLLGRGRLAGQGRHDGDLRRVVGEPARQRAEVFQHRIHQRRVERVRDPQPPRSDPLGFQCGGDLKDRLLDTGDHQRGRTVDRRDRHLIRTPGQQVGDLVLWRLDRDHRPTRGQRLHQPRPSGHQCTCITQRQHPGHMRRRDLPDRVARQHVRTHTPGLDQPEQGGLHREQRRLRPPRLIQQPGLVVEQHLAQRTTQPGRLKRRLQLSDHLVQRLREHREPVVQLPAHPCPLAPLTGEQHRKPRLRPGHSAHHTGARPVLGNGPQSGQRTLAILGDHHRPVLERRPRRHQREPHIGQPDIRHTIQVRRQPPGLHTQRLIGPARDQQRHRQPGRRVLGCHVRDLRGFLDRLLLDDHVGVGAADPERRHGGPARVVGLRPLHPLGHQLDRTLTPVHMRGRRIHMQRARHHTLAHRHDHLDHTGDTRSRLAVTDVRLDRPKKQRPVLRPILPIGRQQSLRLDRVTQRRPGAVRLDHVDIRVGQPRPDQRLPDHPLLRRTIGRRQAVGGAILVDRAAPQHREYRVAQPPRVRQPLQHQDADALRPDRAVSRRRERLAPAVRRQAPLPAELHEHAGVGHHRDAAGQGQGALPGQQGTGRLVQCDQGRGTRGVHGDRGPLQAQRVSHPPGHDAGGGAGQQVPLESLGGGVERGDVVLRDRSDEHTGTAAAQGARVDPGPLHRLPRRLQQQPLLRIHRQRLTRRDPEEPRVEPRRVRQEPAHP